ncbi:hypothetical protein PoB_001168400 [Plakobranchus ocellatus]|uniref:Uncharacterized protein n=1 Tax=Plakobranchus ocellatus TaxID=259542 RepID=A0AAV3YT93_9GAST|nr:hypothetical protein PoB_001168400 [Plakobranchus ocellatus]
MSSNTISNTISSNISNSSRIDNSNTSFCGGNGINSIESQTAAASTAACTSSNYTSSNIRISSSMDNGNTSSGGGNKLTGSKKCQYHKASAIISPTALASVPRSIRNNITNSSSVSTTKHQQSCHQQQQNQQR